MSSTLCINWKKTLEELNKFPLIFIVGPTAVGKSQWALDSAYKFHGAVVNFDSMQFYKGLDIGTAKPTLEDFLKAPHYLFDEVSLGGEFTAGKFREKALSLIQEKLHQEPLFFVGGSGFYLRALLQGMFENISVPDFISHSIKEELQHQGNKALYQRLKELDPEYAAKIHSQDTYRLHRALCIIKVSGKTLTDVHKDFANQSQMTSLKENYTLLGFYLERERLKLKVEGRLDVMLKSGFIEEVESLIKVCDKSWKPLQAVGYREVVAYLNGNLDRDSMKMEIIKNTLQLAKRQMTWFRKQQGVNWFHAENEMESSKSFIEKVFNGLSK